MSPLTPGDLLIALHNIDSNKCDMKSIIKGQFLTFSYFIDIILYNIVINAIK